MDLKARVLEFISHHENGVKIVDMEKLLCERRMKIGFVTNSLLEEGKIQKVDNKYFPAKKEDKFILRDISGITK